MKHVARCCSQYWFNYATEVTSVETPAELPMELAEELRFDAGTFFHNSVTQEASWEDPAELSWRAIKDGAGRVFWFHPKVCFPLCVFGYETHALGVSSLAPGVLVSWFMSSPSSWSQRITMTGLLLVSINCWGIPL